MEMSKQTNRPGGGMGSRVVREVGVRNGAPASRVSPGGVSQIGSQLGNHSTGKGKILRGAVEPTYQGPMGGMGSVPLGNQVATNVGAGGPGKGRVLYGQSGTNQTYGAPNPGNPTPKRGTFE
jgi:hypothetical protein